MVHRALTATHLHNGIVLNMVGDGAPYPAVRTDGIDSLGLGQRDVSRERLVEQCAGRTHRGTLPARHTGGLAHRQVQVKADVGMGTLAGTANDLVALDDIAAANAAVAQDASIMVDSNDRRGHIVSIFRDSRLETRTLTLTLSPEGRGDSQETILLAE